MRWRSFSQLITCLVSTCDMREFSCGAACVSAADDVVPRKYTIELTIDPSQPTFSGIVQIEVELRRETDEIWLNGKDLITGSADGRRRGCKGRARGRRISG